MVFFLGTWPPKEVFEKCYKVLKSLPQTELDGMILRSEGGKRLFAPNSKKFIAGKVVRPVNVDGSFCVMRWMLRSN